MSGLWFTALHKIWLSVIIKVFPFNRGRERYTLNTALLIHVQIERKQANKQTKAKNTPLPKPQPLTVIQYTYKEKDLYFKL